MITLTHFFVFSAGVSIGMASKQILTMQDILWGYILTVLKFLVTLGGFRNAKLNRLQNVKAELYTRKQIEAHFEPGTWEREAYDSLAATLMARDRIFPCIYGTKGFKANELSYLFLDSEELYETANVEKAAKGILDYHTQARDMGHNTSLVIFAAPPTKERTVDDYNTIFWRFLKQLRKYDPKPWPKDIPQETQAQKWCFVFDDTPSFIGVLTPAHRQRLSRHTKNLCMVYQPRYLFDALFSTNKSRNAATATVRGLVDKYDAIPRSPDISDYALPGTTESRQYFLLDENVSAVCPYDSLEAEDEVQEV